MKKNLAIKGHATRGEEVIELLGMLGGSNAFEHIGNNPRAIYYIDETYANFITCSETKKACDCIIFTLEEFLEKYPYKVGDKVINTTTGDIVKIVGLVCQENTILYNYHVTDINYYGVTTVNKLLPYKEAPMYLNGKANKQSEEIKKTIEAVKEIMEEKDTMGHTSELNLNHPVFKGSNEIEIIIPDGWEFKQRDNKMFGVRKQPQYPKTYKDCCDVLGLSTMDNDAQGYKAYLIINFQELIIARNAYWKIAGEQMGLGKPWEPDWSDESENKYTIVLHGNKNCYANCKGACSFLTFPTAEMRDAFYENFKELIEECKTFL